MCTPATGTVVGPDVQLTRAIPKQVDDVKVEVDWASFLGQHDMTWTWLWSKGGRYENDQEVWWQLLFLVHLYLLHFLSVIGPPFDQSVVISIDVASTMAQHPAASPDTSQPINVLKSLLNH